MMESVSDIRELRGHVAQWKREGLRVGFVPTMGNLHAGHHSLVRLARENADRVIVSVFVNPTQFGPNEDFARYPRTPEADRDGLAASGADLLWLPSVDTMYPFGPEAAVHVRVPVVTEVLEGAHRPGHFDGVATVVSRLFHQVQPDVAVFGRKDYQQLAVIRRMVRDMAFPVALLAAPTLREDDGLAMSSRNQFLGPAERPVAARIHQVLQAMRASIQAGVARAEVEAEARSQLEAAGFQVDYAVVRMPELTEPDERVKAGPRVALVAARLGGTRLIDNLEFEA
ncbi:pantoate--beta-alanine ligase [Lysobacter arseniciresistens ZS79]|uniref:Pantothenate synthetase n=1 Tax=Lysobacter arseniciresistens ZS79 TaxID=913325 RepID=A0A0A0ETF9_9GAMM|nr:pantoate--beta-alanine ligase [Lysobacter arseniciresistens]KGM53383.1 pantoate--beta-alanine ligase [Lysobacter arseniciresistens ZS79]